MLGIFPESPESPGTAFHSPYSTPLGCGIHSVFPTLGRFVSEILNWTSYCVADVEWFSCSTIVLCWVVVVEKQPFLSFLHFPSLALSFSQSKNVGGSSPSISVNNLAWTTSKSLPTPHPEWNLPAGEQCLAKHGQLLSTDANTKLPKIFERCLAMKNAMNHWVLIQIPGSVSLKFDGVVQSQILIV